MIPRTALETGTISVVRRFEPGNRNRTTDHADHDEAVETISSPVWRNLKSAESLQSMVKIPPNNPCNFGDRVEAD
jgi:hypothetical protein